MEELMAKSRIRLSWVGQKVLNQYVCNNGISFDTTMQ
jgi:hypothetical protein